MDIEVGNTGLGEIPFPDKLEEINSDSQFNAKEITKEELKKYGEKLLLISELRIEFFKNLLQLIGEG